MSERLPAIKFIDKSATTSN